MKKIKGLQPLEDAWKTLLEAESSLKNTIPLLSDPDESIVEMVAEEVSLLAKKIQEIVNQVIPPLLIPTSPTRDASAIVEIKAGAGGDEASLFAADLMKMYTRFAEIWGRDISSRGEDADDTSGTDWKVTIVSESPISILGKSGYKEVILEIKGKGAYDTFRWENGVHRVQRVPETEKSGRVHTSATAVMVSFHTLGVCRISLIYVSLFSRFSLLPKRTDPRAVFPTFRLMRKRLRWTL
jgi:peptide chain release factor 1